MREEIIRSARNPKVKVWASLREGKYRRRYGLFLAEGPHLVEEALAAGAPVKVVLYAAGKEEDPEVAALLLRAREQGRPVQPVSLDVMEKVCESATPQGIAAVVELVLRSPNRPEGRRPPLYVALDGVQDPGNVGAVLRVARAVAADGVYLGRDTADPFGPKAVRASMGAVFAVPLWCGDLPEAVGDLRRRGVAVVGTGVRGAVRYDRWDWRVPTVLVLGSEGRGLRPEVEALCEAIVSIPMPGGGQSLNIAAAAAVILYEVLRQRSAGTGGGICIKPVPPRKNGREGE